MLMESRRSYHTLVIFSDSFPFGTESERVFMMPEIEAASRAFSRVVLMPTTIKYGSSPVPVLPENVTVDTGWASSRQCRGYTRLWRLAKPSVWFGARGDISRRGLTFSLFADAMASWLSRWIAGNRIDLSHTLFYTFWFDLAAASLSILSRRWQLNCVSSAHGFDIYTSRGGRLRADMVRSFRAIYAASESGAGYLRKQFPYAAAKIFPRRLGSVRQIPDGRAQMHSVADRELTVMSVSNIIDRKRVDLNFRLMVALAKARPSTIVRWIHIGDGPAAGSLNESMAVIGRPENLVVDLRGAMTNEDVQRLYVDMPVDWFMLMSSYEGGCPIAACEAMAYGVPLVVSATTGLLDMVDDDCAVIMPVDVTDEEFVRGMLPYLESNFRHQDMSRAAYDRWTRFFDASVCRRQFMSMLAESDESQVDA